MRDHHRVLALGGHKSGLPFVPNAYLSSRLARGWRMMHTALSQCLRTKALNPKPKPTTRNPKPKLQSPKPQSLGPQLMATKLQPQSPNNLQPQKIRNPTIFRNTILYHSILYFAILLPDLNQQTLQLPPFDSPYDLRSP